MVPAPGYLALKNQLSSGADGCLGGRNMSYQLQLTEAAFAIRTTPNAVCTMDVELLDLDDDDMGRVGGVAIVDTSVAVPDQIGTQVFAVFEWDLIQPCPVLKQSRAIGATVYKNVNYTSWDGDICTSTQEYTLGYFQQWPPAIVITSQHWLRADSTGMTSCDAYYPQAKTYQQCEWKTPVSVEVPATIVRSATLAPSLPGTTTFYGIHP